MSDANLNPDPQKWYEGITKYQWLVLIIASLGWMFDIFEGQIFVASMREAMPELLGRGADHPEVSSWNDWAFSSFLIGGALGGVFFGILSDRIGRSKTMIITILFYSLFTCVTAFAQEPWQMVVLRFFVAMGVGGEWAVAAAMVNEVMPKRSRAVMGSIFHASSVGGTLMAAAAGAFVVGNEDLGWRWGFAIGAFPALLTLWVRWSLREPDKWVAAQERAKSDDTQKPGRIVELFNEKYLRDTIVAVSLSTIGLVTFWGGHIYGKNALYRKAEKDALVAEGLEAKAPEGATAVEREKHKEAKEAAFKKHDVKSAEMLSMTLNTIGGGFGLVLFGWFANRLGRRRAFIFYHVVAFGMVLLLFEVLIAKDADVKWLVVVLPIFGFFPLGMHAGYAVYFPELYPTRLKGTGAGFGFNAGRLASAAALAAFGIFALTPEEKAVYIAPLYLLGALVAYFGRETKDEDQAE